MFLFSELNIDIKEGMQKTCLLTAPLKYLERWRQLISAQNWVSWVGATTFQMYVGMAYHGSEC